MCCGGQVPVSGLSVAWFVVCFWLKRLVVRQSVLRSENLAFFF